jgi:Protein of unknown function (DUF2442)
MSNQFEPNKLEMSDEEFERQFIEATERGKKFLAEAPKAQNAKYESRTKRLILNLYNGATLIIPTENVQGLRGAKDEDLEQVELLLEGTTLHWEKLDVDFYVESFMRGVFGTPKWMSELNLTYIKADDVPQKKVA